MGIRNVRVILGFLFVASALVIACEADKDRVTDTGGNQQSFFQNLTEREHVLNNLELSYTQQSYSPFEKLLDPNFTFFFSPGDVGGNIPPQWGRIEELSVAELLFDRSLNNPNYPTCSSIRMDLKFESGVTWVSGVPEDFPTETWYTATVYYEFTFEMEPDQTYIAVPGSQAQFTVRNAGTDDAPQWRLVEMRDLGIDIAALRSGTGTEKTTWGGVKALYR